MSSPIHVEESRTYPVALERAYERTAPADLTRLMSRRYLVLPPLKDVRDQTPGTWGSQVGASRTLATTDGGTMREELVATEPPHRFAYELTGITGPMKPLVARVEGEWRFEPAGGGTTVTWAWTLHPTSALTAPVVGLVARMWHGYARQALAELEPIIVG